MKPVADVSIIAANFNNGRFLGEFIQSVAESTWIPQELLIIDDGSTDESKQVLESFKHINFLKVVYFETNRGFTAALNAGLDLAGSKYIMRADTDDRLMPGRIEKQFSFLEQDPETDMIGSNASYFNSSTGQPINISNFPLSHRGIVQAYKKGEHGMLHATVCGKAEVYKRYRYQPVSPGEDYELFARMARDGCRFANLKDPLYFVRVHTGSSTSNISYEAIARTFRFRDEIFGTKTGKIRIWFYYNYISFYRKYQLSDDIFVRYISLILAILSYPSKLFKRIF